MRPPACDRSRGPSEDCPLLQGPHGKHKQGSGHPLSWESRSLRTENLEPTRMGCSWVGRGQAGGRAAGSLGLLRVTYRRLGPSPAPSQRISLTLLFPERRGWVPEEKRVPRIERGSMSQMSQGGAVSIRGVHRSSAQGRGIATVPPPKRSGRTCVWGGGVQVLAPLRLLVLRTDSAASPGFPRSRGRPGPPTVVWLSGRNAREKPVRPVVESPWLLDLLEPACPSLLSQCLVLTPPRPCWGDPTLWEAVAVHVRPPTITPVLRRTLRTVGSDHPRRAHPLTTAHMPPMP